MRDVSLNSKVPVPKGQMCKQTWMDVPTTGFGQFNGGFEDEGDGDVLLSR